MLFFYQFSSVFFKLDANLTYEDSFVNQMGVQLLNLWDFSNVLLAKFQVDNEIPKVWPVSVSLMGKNARIPGQATEHKSRVGGVNYWKQGMPNIQ
jgi:hypothetical protein